MCYYKNTVWYSSSTSLSMTILGNVGLFHIYLLWKLCGRCLVLKGTLQDTKEHLHWETTIRPKPLTPTGSRPIVEQMHLPPFPPLQISFSSDFKTGTRNPRQEPFGVLLSGSDRHCLTRLLLLPLLLIHHLQGLVPSLQLAVSNNTTGRAVRIYTRLKSMELGFISSLSYSSS